MKKSGGAEKKRVRRSSAAVQNGTRDPNSDTPPRRQSPKKDVFQLFAEKVRDHKGLVSRWAVLQETRVEYFRGKDFVNFLKNHQELKDILESNKNIEVEEIANTLLRKNLLVRCDRVVKTVRPGKKKLSTWPAHLEIFPVMRATIFGTLYIILGKRVWFFPNILAEEATLRELFRFWPKKDEEERPKWTARLFYAVVAVLVILLLRHHAPDEAARARYQKRMSNIIDDVLEWSPRLALSGMMEKQQTVVNGTEPNNRNSEQSRDEASGNGEDVDQPQHQDHI
ncbi:hypothetical protein GH714_039770 [Hevea brasiliensis]|uniref:Translocation protein SEC62 n=1 Tax=Hevea brasiliensis TaxID=3981 RepID=A0A6A6MYU7_HEVBR|nr:hypothetical protein GH714_039770 [Hevea brasiliensis]